MAIRSIYTTGDRLKGQCQLFFVKQQKNAGLKIQQIFLSFGPAGIYQCKQSQVSGAQASQLRAVLAGKTQLSLLEAAALLQDAWFMNQVYRRMPPVGMPWLYHLLDLKTDDLDRLELLNKLTGLPKEPEKFLMVYLEAMLRQDWSFCYDLSGPRQQNNLGCRKEYLQEYVKRYGSIDIIKINFNKKTDAKLNEAIVCEPSVNEAGVVEASVGEASVGEASVGEASENEVSAESSHSSHRISKPIPSHIPRPVPIPIRSGKSTNYLLQLLWQDNQEDIWFGEYNVQLDFYQNSWFLSEFKVVNCRKLSLWDPLHPRNTLYTCSVYTINNLQHEKLGSWLKQQPKYSLQGESEYCLIYQSFGNPFQSYGLRIALLEKELWVYSDCPGDLKKNQLLINQCLHTALPCVGKGRLPLCRIEKAAAAGKSIRPHLLTLNPDILVFDLDNLKATLF